MNRTIRQNIKHVVVLMMENRSFDHIFGAFPGANGSTTGSNHIDPADSSSRQYSQYAIDVNSQPDFNPGHGFGAMMVDLFGPGAYGYTADGGPMYSQAPVTPYPPMCGFVHQNQSFDDHGNAKVMSYFDYLSPGTAGRLNVLHTLAENYVLFDSWFCETPAMTCPNRHFAHLATNLGNNGNNPSGYAGPGVAETNEQVADGPPLFDAKTIYQLLDELAPHTAPNWAMYGFPWDEYDSAMYGYMSPAVSDPPNVPPRLAAANRSIMDFPVDVLTGKLPYYTFIMPSLLFGSDWANGNSMHPNGDIRLGENLIASVYNVLRNSLIWKETLLIVTFDENGGIYDHVMPAAAVPPDDHPYVNSLDEVVFDYSLAGPRIPALAISPWVKNTVCSDFLQNSSILKFAEEWMAGESEVYSSLTERDGHATSLADLDIWLDSANPDCLGTIPLYDGFPVWGTTLTDPHGDSNYMDAGGDDLGTGPVIPANPQTSPITGQASRAEIEKTAAYDFAVEYSAYYPGHPDSGKPLVRKFGSLYELRRYMQERRGAAQRHYAKYRRG